MPAENAIEDSSEEEEEDEEPIVILNEAKAKSIHQHSRRSSKIDKKPHSRKDSLVRKEE